jgi:hypothetical protein
MFGEARLKLLQERKQELLTRSAGQRELLATEAAMMERRLSWLDSAMSIVRSVTPALGFAAPLIVEWSARRQGGSSWLGRIIKALPIATRFAGLARRFIGRQS